MYADFLNWKVCSWKKKNKTIKETIKKLGISISMVFLNVVKS